jgi:hypothetical protein
VQLVDSLRGLANGLDYLHNFRPPASSIEEDERITKHGYHHDIKPRNILVKGTRLILADFGLSRLRDSDEDTKTMWKHTPPTYGAPEARDRLTFEARWIGRAYDIWSFGCVLSEIATYALEGAALVQNFRKDRELEGPYGKHNCFHHNGDLSQKVSEWLDKMSNRCTTPWLKRIFALSGSLLIADPDGRPTSKDVVENLNRNSLGQWLGNILASTSSMKEKEERKETPSGVFLAKLILERDRLRAWSHTTGVDTCSELGQQRPLNPQTGKDYDWIRCTLMACDAKLSELMNWADMNDAHQRIIASLADANDELLAGLPDSIKLDIENAFHLLAISAKETVQVLAHSAGELGLSNLSSSARSNAISLQQWEAGLLAAARYMSELLSSGVSPRSTVTIIDQSLLKEAPGTTDITTRISVQWYYGGARVADRKPVLVEERSYASKWISTEDEENFAKLGKEQFDRIRELAELFQMSPKLKDLRLLNCLGVYHVPTLAKLGFVYEFPQFHPETTMCKPVSLADIIRQTKKPELNPSLNNKFALSQVVASCVHCLHLSRWLHKSLSSFNIIYFKGMNQDWTELNLLDPYLVGFQHSRQSASTAHSDGAEAKYQMSIIDEAFVHPDYGGNIRFHPAFDYYSLGVILLEIALWRTVGDVISHYNLEIKKLKLDADLQEQPQNSRLYQKHLISIAKKYIPQRMGTGYCAVVIACLDFYEHHKDLNEKMEVQIILQFQQEILQRLQRITLI